MSEEQGSATTSSSTETQFEPLTASYEHLRHSTDSEELHEFARRELPDRAQQAAFSRATALLEAVAGNAHTPLEDRVFLAEMMPFPNVLVKLSQDPDVEVRRAVAANENDKNWLVGRLTKDDDDEVRSLALRNTQTSWKMRLEGAQDSRTDAATLKSLATMEGPKVLVSMVCRAVALNPNADEDTLRMLASHESAEVVHAARSRLGE